MRKKIVYLVLFLTGMMLYTSSGECNWYSQVEIESAVVDYDNEVIFINGYHFGNDPEAIIDDIPLTIINSGDTYIEAEYPSLEPGTYRLSVENTISSYHSSTSIGTLDMTIGAVGPKGEKGDSGEPGSKGDKGDTGTIGPQGDKGDKGDPGAVGPQGDKGDEGDQGAVGPKGDKGDKGDPGAVGPKGDKGDKGDQGDRGAIGLQGVAGPTGDKGDPGETGDPGEKGDPGDPGISRYIQERADFAEIGIQPGETINYEITCPDKRLVLGGGGRVSLCSPLSTPCSVVLGDSYPISSDTWGISFRNLGPDLRLLNISVHAVCADVKI